MTAHFSSRTFSSSLQTTFLKIWSQTSRTEIKCVALSNNQEHIYGLAVIASVLHTGGSSVKRRLINRFHLNRKHQKKAHTISLHHHNKLSVTILCSLYQRFYTWEILSPWIWIIFLKNHILRRQQVWWFAAGDEICKISLMKVCIELLKTGCFRLFNREPETDIK